MLMMLTKMQIALFYREVHVDVNKDVDSTAEKSGLDSVDEDVDCVIAECIPNEVDDGVEDASVN